MCMIWRIHKNSSILCIQSFINLLKCQFCLFLCCKTADHCPALRVQPHICFWVYTLSDYFTCFCKSADKSVLIPAKLFDQFAKLLLAFFQICNISLILFVCCKLFQDSHCIIKLQSYKCRLPIFSKSQAIIPVCIKTSRQSMLSKVLH